MLLKTLPILVLALSAVSAQTSCLVENPGMVIPTMDRSQLYRGQQAFAMRMLAAIQKATPNDNIFFSPYSTYHALLLAYFGARNNSAKELVDVLHLDWAKNMEHVRAGYRWEKVARNMRKLNVKFASADRIYFDQRIQISSCLDSIFEEELNSLDFQGNPEKSRTNINSWIANITANEIPEMLSPGDISANTELVLVNAAYFKGEWASKFDPAHTTEEIFFTGKNNTQFVPMMHKRGTYDLTIDEKLQAHILQIPYLNTDNGDTKETGISMVIILPPGVENALENVLEKLEPDTLDRALKEAMAREIEITLPKFEFERSLELVPILREMGVNSIFDSSADLSGFTADRNLHFGDAKHFAKIKVDEEGSTAAAATVLFSFRSARPVEPSIFRCDHPFVFLIYDHTAKAILFTGIYRDPKTRT